MRWGVRATRCWTRPRAAPTPRRPRCSMRSAHLHQAHGALQMVDVDGVGTLTAGAEAGAATASATARWPARPAARKAVARRCTRRSSNTLKSCCRAPRRSRRACSLITATLQELLGAARIHPADLFFADLSAPADLPRPRRRRRARLRGLPRALRKGAAAVPEKHRRRAPSARTPAPCATRSRRSPTASRTAARAPSGWRCTAFAELVAERPAGRRPVCQAAVRPDQPADPPPVARAGQPARSDAARRAVLHRRRARAVRRRAGAAPRLPPRRHGAGRLRRRAATAASTPQALKDAQGSAGPGPVGLGPRRHRASTRPLEAEFDKALARAGRRQREARRARAGAAAARTGPRRPSDSVAVRPQRRSSASRWPPRMLFVEHGLDQIRQLPDDFDAHAEVVGARLLALAAGETPPAAPQWQGDLSRQIQQGQTVAVLADEMKTGLRQVEKVLDDYYADAAKRPTLAQIDPVLHQLQGALAILDQDDAMRAAAHVQGSRARAGRRPRATRSWKRRRCRTSRRTSARWASSSTCWRRTSTPRKEPFRLRRAGGHVPRSAVRKGRRAATPFDQEDAAAAAAAPSRQQPAPAAPPPAVARRATTAIEAELLEIFIGEAQEVLAFVAATLPAARTAAGQPGNADAAAALLPHAQGQRPHGRPDSFAEAPPRRSNA